MEKENRGRSISRSNSSSRSSISRSNSNESRSRSRSNSNEKTDHYYSSFDKGEAWIEQRRKLREKAKYSPVWERSPSPPKKINKDKQQNNQYEKFTNIETKKEKDKERDKQRDKQKEKERERDKERERERDKQKEKEKKRKKKHKYSSASENESLSDKEKERKKKKKHKRKHKKSKSPEIEQKKEEDQPSQTQNITQEKDIPVGPMPLAPPKLPSYIKPLVLKEGDIKWHPSMKSRKRSARRTELTSVMGNRHKKLRLMAIEEQKVLAAIEEKMRKEKELIENFKELLQKKSQAAVQQK